MDNVKTGLEPDGFSDHLPVGILIEKKDGFTEVKLPGRLP